MVTMASKCSAIIRGYVDFYCLVCESHLLSEEDVKNHISEEAHIKNLDGNHFMEKYKEDCIRKVKRGYFCEFCNILVSTVTKVSLHIAEESHVNNKGSQMLSRVFNSALGVLVFNNTMIGQEVWNGLIEDTCVICNTEFDDKNNHLHEATHILNLVQSKVLFVDNNIYRKIDDSSFHCLTCNVVLALNSLTSHFDNCIHKQCYKSCAYDVKSAAIARAVIMNEGKAIRPENKKLDSVIKKQESPVAAAKPVQTAQKPESSTAKPATTVEVPKRIEVPHPINKASVMPPKETEELDNEIANILEAKDYIISDDKGLKWCLLCDWSMDSMMIVKHVNGKHHAVMLNMHKKRLKQKLLESKTIEALPTKDLKEETKDEDKDDKLDFFLKKFEDYLDIKTGKAVCTMCSEILELDIRFINTHVEEHKKALPAAKSAPKITKEMPITSANIQKMEETKRPKQKAGKSSRASSVASIADKESRASSVASNRDEDEIEKFVKDNNLTYNRRDSKVYCHICDSLVPSSLKNMKEHIAGSSHKNKTVRSRQQSISKDVIVKKSMKEFVTSTRAVENGVLRDVIINEHFCLNIMSFMMLTSRHADGMKCEGCEVDLEVDQIEEHILSPCHQRVISTQQITISQDEFLREVRQDSVHCGFCNLVLANEELPAHLSSTRHQDEKTSSFWRLLQYQQLTTNETGRQNINMPTLVRLLADFF